MVDASENNNCADVAADAVSYYSYRFESCPDYKTNLTEDGLAPLKETLALLG